MKNRVDPLPPNTKYESMFEHSAVSLWEEDISRLRMRLDEMRRSRGFDLRAHLSVHPEFAFEAARLIDVTDVNLASLRLFEADGKDQLLGSLNIVLGTVSRAAPAETILAIDEGRTEIETESTAVTLRGRKLFLIVKTHIPAADEAYPRMLVSLIDITRRREAEEQERANTRILRSIIDSSPDSIFVKDSSLRMVLCNTALAKAIGKEPEDTYGKTDIENGWSVDLVKGDPGKGITGWEKDDLAVIDGQTVERESEPSDFQQGVRYFNTTKFPLRNAEGAIIGLVGRGRDVTERLRAEADLRKAKEFAENLINTANVLVLGLDLEGRVTVFNKTAEEITGYTRAEILHKSWFETVVPRERYPEVWSKFERLAANGEVGVYENPIVTKSGEERYISWQNSQIVEGGRVVGTLSFGIDITEHRQAEADLAWERSLFKTLMDNLPDRIYFKDLESRFIRTSRSHAKSWGLNDPLEEIGKTDADYSSSEHSRKALADEQQVMRTGVPMIDVEDQVTSPEGRVGWFLSTRMPHRDSAGKIVGTFGITHDITRRKQMEADLERERNFLTALMENLPDYIYIKDSTSRFVRTSMAHARVLGLRDPSEAVGKTDFDFYREDYARKAYNDEAQIMRTGIPLVDIEERESYPDGPDTWALTTKMPLRDAEGGIIGTFGITHDITLRKLLEEKNEQLAALVEFADDAIVGLDMNRRITVWNKGAERVYGYTAEEMIAAPTSTLIPPELEDEALTIREKILRGEQVDHFETTRLRKGGTRITVALTLSGVRDASGKIVGMASVARDITQQKAVEARLNRARRLEGLAMLAGGVAHQFNNINTAVKGYLDLLRMEKGISGRLSTYLEAASASVQKAVDITDRLLALTQPAGAAIGRVRLHVLARSVLEAYARRIETENVQVVLDLAETPAVEGGESRLRFVLAGLIGNALDSLVDRPQRVIKVRTGSTVDGAVFEIEDSGCGISEENLPRIFSPFFSGKGEWAPAGSPQWKLKGVGLSLAISSTTISEYGGKIDVQSTTGAGSTFRILLPVALEQA